MDTLIIGDLHGKTDIVQEVLQWNCGIVFVGDYLDSYDRSITDQIMTLMMVLSSINGSRGQIKGLIGNHELSYIEPKMTCSGFNPLTHSLVMVLEDQMRKHLQEHVWVGDYLVSHAGFSAEFVPEVVLNEISKANTQEDKNLAMQKYLNSPAYDDSKYSIGSARGGWSRCGGPFWCDWWQEFEPIEGIKQVVGHSSRRPNRFEGETGIVKKGDNYNIDNLDTNTEALLIREDGSVRIINLMEDL